MPANGPRGAGRCPRVRCRVGRVGLRFGRSAVCLGGHYGKQAGQHRCSGVECLDGLGQRRHHGFPAPAKRVRVGGVVQLGTRTRFAEHVRDPPGCGDVPVMARRVHSKLGYQPGVAAFVHERSEFGARRDGCNPSVAGATGTAMPREGVARETLRDRDTAHGDTIAPGVPLAWTLPQAGEYPPWNSLRSVPWRVFVVDLDRLVCSP